MSTANQTTKATAVVDPATGNASKTEHATGGGFFIKPNEKNNISFQGEPFSLEQVGNKVEFFTTGEKYFEDVAQAIEGAQKSIFITGLQINFDAFLTKDKRLWDCLAKALTNNKEVRIYVMPWCSPKVGLNTFDFEAMFAVFLLNGGLDGPIRAFCMPAIQQTDMGRNSLGFSHHQKSVVIDNEIGYVGGIDLAYGRRDDERFTLQMEWRDGRERYNICIPPTGELKRRESRHYLTFMELFTSVLIKGDNLSRTGRWLRWLFEQTCKTIDDAQAWVYDSLSGPLMDEIERGGSLIAEAAKQAKKELIEIAKEGAVQALDRVPGAFDKLPESVKRYIAFQRALGGALITTPLAAVLRFLNDFTLDDLPAFLWEDAQNQLRALLMATYIKLLYLSDIQTERYSYLESRISEKTGRKYTMLPPGRVFLDEKTQPRMPWQDVHARIEGPSVSDLSNNFVRRWNSLQARLHRDYSEDPALQRARWMNELLGELGVDDDYQRVMEEIEKLRASVEKEATALWQRHEKKLKELLETAKVKAEQLKQDAARLLKTMQGQAQVVRQRAEVVKKELGGKFDGYKQAILGKAEQLGLISPSTEADRAVQGVGFGERMSALAESVKAAVIAEVDYYKQMAAAFSKEPEPFYIADALLPEPASVVAQKQAPKGSCSVQVLRSASGPMIKDEEDALDVLKVEEFPRLAPWKEPARRFGKPGKTGKQKTFSKQDNCQNAIARIIENAHHFLYIEGQFYQSAHGEYGRYVKDEFSGPMGWMIDMQRLPNYKTWAKTLRLDEAIKRRNLLLIDPAKVLEVGLQDPDFREGLNRIIHNQTTILATQLPGSKNDRLVNKINEKMGDRIQRAIYGGQHFHVYIVLPVHPEGSLDTLNIMSQVFLTQQSLHFGPDSLINRIRRSIAAKRFMDGGKDRKGAEKAVAELTLAELEKAYENDWKQYLTLLNLRNWDVIGKRPVTEQIYVHSKLVIADDRVAVLGSANINDRSLEGERDSELAIIVKDGTELRKPITGGAPMVVSKAIHELRVALWKKHFALTGVDTGKIGKADALAGVLEKPADPATWKAIQQVAEANAKAYEAAFPFIPRDVSRFQDMNPKPTTETETARAEMGKRGASIWPGWYYQNPYDHNIGTGKDEANQVDPKNIHPRDEQSAPKNQSAPRIYHPFERLFWTLPGYKPKKAWSLEPNQEEPEEELKEADPAMLPEVKEPQGIKGFITALPVLWTAGENNLSGINMELLANMTIPAASPGEAPGTAYVHAEETAPGKTEPEETVV